MAIIELHLDRPAFKRVEAGPETNTTSTTESGSDTRWDEEDAESSGGGMGRKLLLVALVGAVAFGVMRWRRSGESTEAAIDIGTEETRPKTE